MRVKAVAPRHFEGEPLPPEPSGALDYTASKPINNPALYWLLPRNSHKKIHVSIHIHVVLQWLSVHPSNHQNEYQFFLNKNEIYDAMNRKPDHTPIKARH